LTGVFSISFSLKSFLIIPATILSYTVTRRNVYYGEISRKTGKKNMFVSRHDKAGGEIQKKLDKKRIYGSIFTTLTQIFLKDS